MIRLKSVDLPTFGRPTIATKLLIINKIHYGCRSLHRLPVTPSINHQSGKATEVNNSTAKLQKFLKTCNLFAYNINNVYICMLIELL